MANAPPLRLPGMHFAAAFTHFAIGTECPLDQLLPVAVGAPIRSQHLAYCTFALLVVGVPTFVASLATSTTALLPIGAGLIAVAAGILLGSIVRVGASALFAGACVEARDSIQVARARPT